MSPDGDERRRNVHREVGVGGSECRTPVPRGGARRCPDLNEAERHRYRTRTATFGVRKGGSILKAKDERPLRRGCIGPGQCAQRNLPPTRAVIILILIVRCAFAETWARDDEAPSK